ncbi:hypothetical protein [Sphingobacterium hotanense]|uniref:Uncharacterized protein n=1 Tax=Sphingobacterium hotanense TaxID=649196 RepID=A0ABT7NL90_9SPHI|nr:hypothetical protein [Sphingobacterium hotanense]MDM1047968.1 hypothetical protein [Sphingobacterium hotanense]
MIRKIKLLSKLPSEPLSFDYYQIINEKTKLKGIGVYLHSGSELLAWSEVNENYREVRFYICDKQVSDELELGLLRNLVRKYKYEHPEYIIIDEFKPISIY